MRAQAAVEENVRLALWRMDSAIAPIIAREGMLPATDFLGPMVPGEFVRLNFQFDPGGALSSPQSEGESLVAFARLVSHEQISTALAAERYSQEILMVAANNDSLPAIAADDASLLGLEKDDGTAGEQLAQLQKSSNEYMQRSWTVGNVYPNSFANPVHQIVSESDGLESGPFTDAEMSQIAKGMRPLVRPSLNYIAEVDGEPAAMSLIITVPAVVPSVDHSS